MAGMDGAALGFALGAAVLFALGLVFGAIGLRHRSARRGAAISIPTATVFFLLISPVALDVTGFSWTAVLIFAAVGLAYPALATLLTFEASRRAGPGVAGALGNLAPLFAVLFAVLVLGETPTLLRMAGIAVIVAGIILISLPGPASAHRVAGWALILPLLAAAMRGASQAAVKAGLFYWPEPFAAALVSYILSTAIVIGTVGMGGSPPTPKPGHTGVLWFALVGLCNGLAVLTLYAALGRAPVTVVAPLVAVYPLFTLILGALLLRSSPYPSSREIAGIVVTVAGVALLLSE